VDDRQVLEEHALKRRRLVGMLLHGAAWRERSVRGTARRVLAGLVLGVLACAALAAASFVSEQLAAGGLGQGRTGLPVPGASTGVGPVRGSSPTVGSPPSSSGADSSPSGGGQGDDR
jgi:hypothetical protein